MCGTERNRMMGLPTTISVYFSDLPDPRIDRCKRHLLTDILTITLCAMVANADTWVDIADFGTDKAAWLRTF
ncbi:transposase family protein [Chloroflexia bacterium SDU3-3]|nr:transposase family protein [Chloroflexia bacterium SDU3-3]